MAMRDIRVVGDPVLRTPCDPITDIDDRVRALVADLLETVDHEGRAGLAANQIGVSLQAFSWNIEDEVGYVLNPRLVAVSEEEYQDGDEGCLSVPGLWFPTERAWYARVEGIDLDGKEIVVEGDERGVDRQVERRSGDRRGGLLLLLLVVLVLDVLHYHLVRDVPRAGHKIAPAPKMPPPE